MDNFEKHVGEKRRTQTVTLEGGIPGTEDYLRLKYKLPNPYTAEEYCQALDDFNRRYDAGERTEG